MSFQLKPATRSTSSNLVKRTVAVAQSAKYELTPAQTVADGVIEAVMTNQAFFIKGDETIVPEVLDDDGKVLQARRVIHNPTPVADLRQALSVGVTGTRFEFLDATEEVDLAEPQASNWFLRSQQLPFNNRPYRSGSGLAVVIIQTIDGTRYETAVRLDQMKSVIDGQRHMTQGEVPMLDARIGEVPVVDADGPVFVDGKPVMRQVELKPADVFTSFPTWEELTSLSTVSLRDEDGNSDQYRITDILEWDLAQRNALYAENHNGEMLDKQAIDCIVTAIGTNHHYAAKSQPIYNEDRTRIIGTRGPADIRHNSGDWHLAKAGLNFGAKGPFSTAWIGFIGIGDLVKAICGYSMKPHFYGPREVKGQTYNRGNRSSNAGMPARAVVAAGLVEAEGEKAF